MKPKPVVPMTEEQRKLAEANIKLVYHFLKVHNLDYDRYVDLLYIGLCKAAKTYDPSRNRTFSTYACRVFTNEIRMDRRKEEVKRARYNIQIQSGDELLYPDQKRSDTLFDMIPSHKYEIDDVITEADLERFLQSMSEHDRKVFELRLQGFNQCQIAKKLSYSQSYISRIISKQINRFLHEKHNGRGY